MLETEIKNNTAALAALAAAVADLTAALRVQNPAPASMPPVNPVPAAAAPVAPAPASMPPVNPVAAPAAPAAPVVPAPASMPPVTPVPAAAAPALAPAPASMSPVNPVPAAAAPAPVAAPTAMSGDDLRKLCVRAGAAGLTAEVVQFLSEHGVAKLAALPPADYPALVALLKSKGVE